MPITIQEIIASDTISQFVDKTNFNFDQLLLNGGGPSGPIGPNGPTGPAGGRGLRGSTWYDDAATTSPGNTPNAVPPTATPLIGDYYLQFDGQVWEYNGTTWVITTIDLQGPVGPTGSGGGFSEQTGAPIFNKSNILYNGPIGLNNGANSMNEGVPSVMIGGVTSQTQQLTGIPFTAAYIVPEAIVIGNPSTLTSLLIHQRDSNSRGIVFHGGDTGIVDDYEQVDPALLSNISIGIDDKLILNVPKHPTSPLGQNQMRGIELSSEERSQLFRAGSDILFQSGVGPSTQLFGGQHSNFEINVGVGGSGGGGNVFKTVTLGSVGKTVLEAGNSSQIALVTNQSTQTGSWQVQAGAIRGVASSDIKWYGASVVLDSISAGGGGAGSGPITLQSGSGGISLTTAGGGNINLNSANNIQFISGANIYNFNNLDNINPSLTGIVIHDAANNIGSINTASGFTTGVLSWDGTELQSSSGTDTSIVRWDGVTEIEDSNWFIDDTGNMYPTATTQTLGTAAKRIGTVYLNSVIDYSSNLTFNGTATNVTFTPGGLVGIGVGSSELTAYLNVRTNIRMHRPHSFISGDIQAKFSGDFSILNLMGGAGGTTILDYTDGGHVYLTGGTGSTVLFRPDGDGGKVYINGGIPAGVGNTGNVIIGLDTSDINTGTKIGVFNDAPVYDFDLLSDAAVGSATGAARIKISETGNSTRPTLSLENSNNQTIKFYNNFDNTIITQPVGLVSGDAALIYGTSNISSALFIGSNYSSNYIRISNIGNLSLNSGDASASTYSDVDVTASDAIVLNSVGGVGSTNGAYYLGNKNAAGNAPEYTASAGNKLVLAIADGGGGTDENRIYCIPVKSFVIEHPNKPDNYLVHACLEGPESAVYYRGEGKLEDNTCIVKLPEYFEGLTKKEGRTVQLTVKIDNITDEISNVAAGKVIAGTFFVRGYGGTNKTQSFYWEVKAVRNDVKQFEVEPSKDDYELKGDGPYTYLVKR